MQKLCYVDPVYFIEHKLYNKIKDPNCAYFDIFPEDLIKNYSPLAVIEEYPHYIASGMFADILYYDVCKHITEDHYNLLISMDITLSDDITEILYIAISFDKNTESENYTGLMYIITYESQYDEGYPSWENEIFFDNFNDLLGIIKNRVRQHVILTKRNKND